MQYWQIAAGSQGRDYAKDFLRFGMAFVGGPQQMSKMAEVEIGDRVLLKRGMSHIVAVGEVVQRDGKHRGENDKKWLMSFTERFFKSISKKVNAFGGDTRSIS